jgi:hypothetical protein
MQTFHLSCPFTVDPIHVFLFTEVLNALELKSKLLAGDLEYLYAFLDAELVNTSMNSADNSDRESTAVTSCHQQSIT